MFERAKKIRKKWKNVRMGQKNVRKKQINVRKGRINVRKNRKKYSKIEIMAFRAFFREIKIRWGETQGNFDQEWSNCQTLKIDGVKVITKI